MTRYVFLVKLPSGKYGTCTDRFSERSLIRAIKMMAVCGMTVIEYRKV